MNKKRIKRALLTRKWYNFTERVAQMALRVGLPENICIEKNVKYGELKMECLDFIYDNSLEKKDNQPMLIYIHGGGWLSGIKDMRRYYCYEWAKKGYFVANLDYTYAPDKQFPEQFQQLFNAIDYILDKEEKYSFNSKKVILGGESAGGYFITMLAVLLKNRELFDKLGLSFKHYDTFFPKALISICGVIDLINLNSTGFPDIEIFVESFLDHDFDYLVKHIDDEQIRNTSPIHYISGEFPPTMIISAENDKLKGESYNLAEILKALKVDYKTFEGTGIISNHAFPIAVKLKKGRECFDSTVSFIEKYIV